MLVIVPMLALLGCLGMDDSTCERELLPLNEVTPPVTEADVWATLEAFHPTTVEWTSIPGMTPRGDTGSADTAAGTRVVLAEPASVRIERAPGEAQAVRYEGEGDGCPSRVGLWLLVVVTTDIGSGRIAQSKSKALEAFGRTLEQVRFDGGTLSDEVAASIDGDWVSTCFEDFKDEDFVDVLDETWLTLDGPLNALEAGVAIGVDRWFKGDKLHGVSTCAAGTVR